MKYSFLAAILVAVNAMVFPYQITIPVQTDFSLNPVIGITGKRTDSNSRFIHRMLFSPLVMPMTDPVIDPNFTYDMSVSLVTKTEYKYVRADGREVFYEVDNLDEPDIDIKSNVYRVQIRNDVYFNIGTRQYDQLNSEDVVFSYRTAQTTLSIKQEKTVNRYDNYTNAILRAQLADMNTVTYIDGQTIEFTFTVEKHAREFMKFLTYTPILSVKQLRGGKEQERQNYSLKTGPVNNYNMWDASYSNRIRDFERLPAGYGQFTVEDRAASSSGNAIPVMISNVKLVKNRNWTPVYANQSNVLENAGLDRSNHKKFQNNSDRIIIKNVRNITIEDSIIKNPTQLLINYPLTVDDYRRSNEAFDLLAEKLGVQEMHISHKIYGFLYSPEKILFLDPKIKIFFNDCLNRTLIAALMRLDPRFTVQANPTYKKMIKDKVSAVSMYYPFFAGSESEKAYSIPTKLDNYRKELQEQDISYRTRTNFLKEMEAYFERPNDYKDIYGYMVGELWEEMQNILTEEYNKIIENIPTEEITGKNLNIRILYDSNDKVAKIITDVYYRTLNKLSSHIKAKGTEINLIVKLVPLDVTGKKEITDVPKTAFDIAIYGWDYRFDFLSEFLETEFIDPIYSGDLNSHYRKFLEKIGTTSVSDAMYDFAREIVDTQIITPILGIQNYVIYNKEKTGLYSLEKLGKQVMMYPYYWN